MAEIGSTIPRNNPRYQILKKIGQGGMSEVYLANDLQMDMMVAVKEVRTDIEYDKHGRKVDLNAYTMVKDVGGVTNKVTKQIIEDLGREYATYYNTVNSAYDNKSIRDIIKQSEGAV